MIRHFNASHPFKAYLMLTLFPPRLTSTNVALHTSNTNPLNEHFREGRLVYTLEGQEGCGRKCKLEARFSHLQMTVEVGITRGVSDIFTFD